MTDLSIIFSLLLLASRILATLAALLLSRCHLERRRAAAFSAHAATPISRPERVYASPGFRRRRSQDHEAFLVSCRALQTSRPCCVACTLNNMLLLLSMRAASAASSQRYAEQHRGLAPAARRIMSLSSYRVPHCRRLAHAESHAR